MRDPFRPREAKKEASLLLADLFPVPYAIDSADFLVPGLQKIPQSLLMLHPMTFFFCFYTFE